MYLDYLVIIIVCFGASILTFFSGFGLGTILLPAFGLFFPIETAVAATAIVHLSNNVFKFALVGKHADKKIFLRFVIPAVIASFAGAALLNYFTGLHTYYNYTLFGYRLSVTPVNLVIAVLMLSFAVIELIPGFDELQFKPKYVPVGGVLSGFFGGLSGHQGALRTAFLIRTGLEKEKLIGTMVSASIFIDITRIAVYSNSFLNTEIFSAGKGNILYLIITGIIAAFAGSFLGSKLLKKVTIKSIKYSVAAMLIVIGLLLGAGVI